jgi:hypothetical protein
MDWRIGVTNLLSPDNCTLLLIDHQGLQFPGVQNIDGTLLINNVVGLTKSAKVFGVPTVRDAHAAAGAVKHGGRSRGKPVLGPTYCSWPISSCGHRPARPSHRKRWVVERSSPTQQPSATAR